MCKKQTVAVLALSFWLIASASAGTVSWNFEDGDDHGFDLWSLQEVGFAWDDPNIAGDESLTGAGGLSALPDVGMAWSIGEPNQYDGLIPPVVEGCHVVDGVLQYGPCNDPFGAAVGDPPYDFTNSRGQSSYLNTYNLSQWGDNLHTAANDQIATSPPVILGEGAVLTVWAHGGGSGTHAPEYDANPSQFYADGSSGVAVLLAEDFSLLASVLIDGHDTLKEATLDLSAFAGEMVLIEVVDAFDGAWGWLAVDEIQITNATAKTAGLVVQLVDGQPTMGFDQAQIDHLTMLGYYVQVIDQEEIRTDQTFTRDDANDLDILIISESISSSGADLLIGTSAPTMHQEAYGWDNHHFMGAAVNIHWESGSDVNIVNDTHPIVVNANVGLGTLPFFDPSSSWTTEVAGNLAPGAELLAQITVDSNDMAIAFAIEKGAELANASPAASRIVGFSLPGLDGAIDASVMTDEAWALYDAAIRWLDPPAPTAALVVSSTDLSAGFDQAIHDRLGAMGYAVTDVSSSDVGSTFTIAEAETFDVLVVSESIGSSGADPLIGANVPMMHNESYGWDNHRFTTKTNSTWVNDPNGMMDVVNDVHPISMDAGLSAGPLQFFANPAASWTAELASALAPGAENLAQITSEGDDFALVFAIEQGAELVGGTPASSRIVGFSIPGNESFAAGDMTDDAWAFFEAAIRWLDAVD